MEGADLVAAGLACGQRPQVVFVQAERADELVGRLGLDEPAPGALPPAVYPVIPRVAAKIATLEAPPDAMAVFPLPERRSLASLRGPGTGPKAAALRRQAGEPPSPVDAAPLVVYADGMQDPGNVGTLLRAAVAFGAAALVTGPGSADPYGPKTVRASMGAVFGVPVVADAALDDLVEALDASRVYGLAAHEGAPLRDAELSRPAVLVVGAERHGISDAARPSITDWVTIPLAPLRHGLVESLNAGVAGAIALYEFSRRPTGAADDTPPLPAAPAKG